MPHASDFQGIYIPHNTNRYAADGTPLFDPDSSVLNDSSRSVTSAQKIQVNVGKLKQIPVKAGTSVKKFWTPWKIVLLVGVIVILIAAAVVLGVLLSNNSSTTATTTSSTISSNAATTAVTTTTASTNPCRSGSLLWSTTGTTVLSSSQLTSPDGMFMDSSNNLYVVDEYSNSVVWKLLSGATNATLVAGIAQSRGTNSTQLNYPQGVYADASGNIYVTDYYNYRVQKYSNGSTNGTTIAGVTGSASNTFSLFNGLRLFAVDPTETYMFITDFNNHRVMRYLTNSTSGTNGVLMAGNNGAGYSNTTLYGPWGIYYSPTVSSDLFITNYYAHSVIRWTPGASSGYFVAGVPGTSGQTPVLLNNPTGIKVDIYLNMYVADYSNHRIQLFCYNSQTAVTLAGTGIAGSGVTQLNGPRDIVFDSSLNMYISDTGNIRVQKFLKL